MRKRYLCHAKSAKHAIIIILLFETVQKRWYCLRKSHVYFYYIWACALLRAKRARPIMKKTLLCCLMPLPYKDHTINGEHKRESITTYTCHYMPRRCLRKRAPCYCSYAWKTPIISSKREFCSWQSDLPRKPFKRARQECLETIFMNAANIMRTFMTLFTLYTKHMRNVCCR